MSVVYKVSGVLFTYWFCRIVLCCVVLPHISAVNDAEAAMRVGKHLQRLQGQWQHILQDSVYDRLMGYLLEYVLRAVMKPVFEVI